MSYGFEIRGDAGNIVVDDLYPVFQVIEQAYIPPAETANSYLHKVKFTRTYADPPLLILFPPDGRPGFLHTFRFSVDAAGNVDGFVAELYGDMAFTPARAFNWRYAVATDRIPYGEEPYGLRVWDSVGRLIYDSAWPLAYFRAPLGSALTLSSRTKIADMNAYETYRDIHEAPVQFGTGASIGILASTWASKSGEFDFSLAFGFASGARDRVAVALTWTSHASEGRDWALRFASQVPILAAM